MAEVKKVFDVAPAKKTTKPTPTSPQITSTHTTAPLSDTQPVENNSTEDKIAVTVKPKEVTVQHEKLIAPLEQVTQKEDTGTIPVEASEGQSTSSSSDTVSSAPKAQEPEMVSSAASVEPAGASTLAEEAVSPPQSTELSTQVPKIFDSTEYQLPIQQRASIGTGGMMVKFVVVFMVLLLLAAVIAIDAGWLDVGISLPFDVI